MLKFCSCRTRTQGIFNGFTKHQEIEKDFQLYTASAAFNVVYSTYSLILFMIFRSIAGSDTLHRDSSSDLGSWTKPSESPYLKMTSSKHRGTVCHMPPA
jgi:hypothetical protein